MKPTAQVIVRMPPELYVQLKRQADHEQQSLNALIIKLLDQRTAPNV